MHPKLLSNRDFILFYPPKIFINLLARLVLRRGLLRQRKDEKMKAYKGFNKDMTCRGFQYEIGKTYETDKAELCSSGFHACENPLDCFGYYAPGSSKYCEVEIEDNGERNSDDSKVVGKKITIGAELTVPMLCKLHFEYVTSKCKPANSRVAGNNESASAGECGSASAGNSGSAVSRGISIVETNGVAVARGNNVRVKGGIGSILVICEENKNDYDIKDYKVVVVDGKVIKADTFYKLENGEFVECE